MIFGILLASLLLLPLCTDNKETQAETTKTTAAEKATDLTTAESTEPATTFAEAPLSELQTEACNNADAGGTCESKLKELGVVPLEDCCEYLGKCCV